MRERVYTCDECGASSAERDPQKRPHTPTCSVLASLSADRRERIRRSRRVAAWQRERVANASPDECAWCGERDDLEQAEYGERRKPIWICRNQHDCRARNTRQLDPASPSPTPNRERTDDP